MHRTKQTIKNTIKELKKEVSELESPINVVVKLLHGFRYTTDCCVLCFQKKTFCLSLATLFNVFGHSCCGLLLQCLCPLRLVSYCSYLVCVFHSVFSPRNFDRRACCCCYIFITLFLDTIVCSV